MLRSLSCLLLLATAAPAKDPAAYPEPPKAAPDEPVAKAWSPAKAAAYLDAVGVNWTRDRACVTCHTNLPYLMARPLLKGSDDGVKEVRGFLEGEATAWRQGQNKRAPAYYVATAAGLAFTDAGTGKLSADTRAAFDKVWESQKPTGEWDWIKCDWPPLEHDDYYGAVLAAVAVGVAPERYAASDAAKPGVAKLKAYLAKTPAPDLHHRAMLLWAAARLDGLLTADRKAEIVAELKKKQRADGGWGLPALGSYVRKDQSANDPDAASDGYGTGFAVYVLRQAGVPAEDAAVKKGIGWLKGNQRESGRWFTRSLNTDKRHYIANAGTAFAVMALAECGEPVAGK